MATARKTKRSTTAKKRSSTATKKTSAAKKPAAKKASFRKANTASKPSAQSAAAPQSFAECFTAGQDWMKQSTEAFQQFFPQDFAQAMPSPFDSAGKPIPLTESLAAGSETFQMAAESGNQAVQLAQKISEEFSDMANQAVADQVELSKALLACRNVNDVMEIQTQSVSRCMEQFFSDSLRLSNLLFQTGTEIAEPLQQRANEAAQQWQKTFTAA